MELRSKTHSVLVSALAMGLIGGCGVSGSGRSSSQGGLLSSLAASMNRSGTSDAADIESGQQGQRDDDEEGDFDDGEVGEDNDQEVDFDDGEAGQEVGEQGNCDDEQDDGNDENDGAEDQDASDENDGSTLLALEGEGSVAGLRVEIQYEQETTGTSFELDIAGGTPGASFDVTRADRVLLTVTLDSKGAAHVEYSSAPEDAEEQALPADFPTLAAGDTLAVASVSVTLGPDDAA